MLDHLVAAGQFRDCFIFLPEGSRLSGYTDHSRAVMVEEDSVADPPPTSFLCLSSQLCDAKL